MRGGWGYGKLNPKVKKNCNKRWTVHQRSHHHLSSSQTQKYYQKKNHFKAKKPFKRFQCSLLAPSAPLNTTSYIIRIKGNHLISPIQETPTSPVLDSYGSMKGLLGLQLRSEDTDDVEEWQNRDEAAQERLGVVCSPANTSDTPKVLAWRIRKQDYQLAHLEEEGVMLKERLTCMEEELDSLKDRVRILELNNAVREVSVCSGDASFV